MLRVEVSCDATRTLKYLDGMVDRSKDFRPVFGWAKRELEKANAQNFATNGLPVGGWSPLKPRYSAWKARNFPGAPMLIQTGRLFRSLTNLRTPPSNIGKTSATFGTDVEYAKFHQYGTTKMDKRKIVFEPPAFARQLADNAAKYIVDGRNRTFRR
jgi:phage gpG-like protein